jgi:hypothetical protein
VGSLGWREAVPRACPQGRPSPVTHGQSGPPVPAAQKPSTGGVTLVPKLMTLAPTLPRPLAMGHAASPGVRGELCKAGVRGCGQALPGRGMPQQSIHDAQAGPRRATASRPTSDQLRDNGPVRAHNSANVHGCQSSPELGQRAGPDHPWVASGRRGRGFKSCHPDHTSGLVKGSKSYAITSMHS